MPKTIWILVVKLTVLVTAFMKESSIRECLRRLLDVLDQAQIDFRIILLDDSSRDRTALFASEINDPRIEIHVGDHNLGKGGLISANLYRVETPITAIFDGDLDLHPDVLVRGHSIICQSESISAVVGSKLHPESQVHYPFHRRILSRIFQGTSKVLFGLGVSDTQTGAKVFRTSELKIAVSESKSTGFVFDLEVLARLANRGYAIKEIPIRLNYDFTSSIGIKSVFQVCIDLCKVWLQLHRANRTH